MPSLPLALGMLLLRFSISQMDVPTRQAYTLALVVWLLLTRPGAPVVVQSFEGGTTAR